MTRCQIFWLIMSGFVLVSPGLTEARCNCKYEDSGGWTFGSFLLAAGAAVGAVAAAPLVLTAAGFTAAGVAAGSVAASTMSSSVAAGSVFATLQSAGAAGISYATTAAIGTTAGSAAYYATSDGCHCD